MWWLRSALEFLGEQLAVARRLLPVDGAPVHAGLEVAQRVEFAPSPRSSWACSAERRVAREQAHRLFLARACDVGHDRRPRGRARSTALQPDQAERALPARPQALEPALAAPQRRQREIARPSCRSATATRWRAGLDAAGAALTSSASSTRPRRARRRSASANDASPLRPTANAVRKRRRRSAADERPRAPASASSQHQAERRSRTQAAPTSPELRRDQAASSSASGARARPGTTARRVG